MLRPPLDSSTLVPAWRRVHKVPAVWSSAPRGPPGVAVNVPSKSKKITATPAAGSMRKSSRKGLGDSGPGGQRSADPGAKIQGYFLKPNIFYGEYSGWWNIARLKIGDYGHLKKPMDN